MVLLYDEFRPTSHAAPRLAPEEYLDPDQVRAIRDIKDEERPYGFTQDEWARLDRQYRRDGARIKCAGGHIVLRSPEAQRRLDETALRVMPEPKPKPARKPSLDTARIAKVIAATAEIFHVTPEEILSPLKLARIVRARHMAIHAASQLTDPAYSLSEIGRVFRRTKTSIRYAVSEAEKYIRADKGFRDRAAKILARSSRMGAAE